MALKSVLNLEDRIVSYHKIIIIKKNQLLLIQQCWGLSLSGGV